jgi:TonB-linked outer membrane protein, SusC/RagA family
MKIKIYTILTMALLFCQGILNAQVKSISGTVMDQDGLPLPGTNILIKGTNTGVQTDFDGNYSIQAANGDVLVFSYLGYQSLEIKVEAETINVQMQPDAQNLEEVVVTAQGVKREKKALGYAVSTVSSAEIEQKPQQDVARSLNGKIAGVQITGVGGATGSGTNFLIRSKNSINGDNQPLFIVDGVPFDSGTNAQANFVDGNNNTSSRFLDLDPNNIVSISVLKGLSAAVLYGQQGRNGVVLITTKNGASTNVNNKFEVTLNTTAYLTQVANLPDFQNEYGQGGDNTLNSGFVGNWGSRLDQGLMISHPYNGTRFADVFPEYQGVMIPYVAAKNNVKDFFRTGYGSSTSVNVSGGSGTNSLFNLSFGHTNEDGFIPFNNLNRINLGIGGSTKLENGFTFGATLNYARTSVDTPPISAANGVGALSIFTRLLYLPRSLDIGNLPYQNPIDGSNVFYRTDLDNPYWLLHNAGTKQENRRLFGNLSTSYNLNDHVSFNYRLGLDTYTETQKFFVNKGSVTDAIYTGGFLRTTVGLNTILDHNISASFNNMSLTEHMNLNATIGFNARMDEYKQQGVANTNQIVFNVLTGRNFINQSQLDPITSRFLSYESKRNILGLYGQLEVDYDSFLYLTLSGRNDWGSTVEAANQSLFYPGASISFIPTSAFEGIRSNTVNFLKLRAGYGTSAGFPGPYNTRPTLSANPNAFIGQSGLPTSTNSLSSIRPNPNLKPELHKEIELGIEGNFINNRVNLDATIYKRISEDQILSSNLAPATGFTSTTINAGQIDTKGIEIGLGITLLKSKDFTWSMNNNFTAYETTVVDLPEGLDEINFAGFSNLGNFAIPGQPLGVIKGNFIVKDEEGNFMINPNTGKIFNSSDVGLPDAIIGDPNPDWNLSNIHTFSFKGLSLSAQLEYQHGGDIYSNTTENLIRRGVISLVDREKTHVIPGYLGDPNTGEPLKDSNGNKIPNEIQLGANELYFLNLVDPAGANIYDATHLRLREVTLGYSLPKKLLGQTPFGSISFALSGQNLWFKAFNFPDAVNFDPETLSTGVGNGSGMDFQTAPTAKRYSFSIKATF